MDDLYRWFYNRNKSIFSRYARFIFLGKLLKRVVVKNALFNSLSKSRVYPNLPDVDAITKAAYVNIKPTVK